MSQTIEVHNAMRASAEKYAAARRAWLIAEGPQPELERAYREAADDLAGWAAIRIFGVDEWKRLGGDADFFAKRDAEDAARAAKRAAEPAEAL